MRPGRQPISPTRRGLTLVELLAVIAIIGLLVAMLLPAVQSARESSRRMQCGNNVRQIALAAVSHESSAGRLPPGIIDLPLMGTGWPGHTVFAHLLSRIDQTASFQQYRFDCRNLDPINDPATSVVMPVYQCPSDNAGSRLVQHPPSVQRWSRSNYAFSMGSNTMCIDAQGQSVAHTPASGRTGWNLANDGPFWMATVGRPLAAIRDGTAFTGFFSEVRSGQDDLRGSDVTWDSRGVWAWHSVGSSAYTHRNTPNSSVGDALWANPGQDIQCVVEPGMPCDNTNGIAFDRFHAAARSRHPGGVQVAFADGHVTFYVDATDATLWRALGSATGREPVAAE